MMGALRLLRAKGVWTDMWRRSTCGRQCGWRDIRQNNRVSTWFDSVELTHKPSCIYGDRQTLNEVLFKASNCMPKFRGIKGDVIQSQTFTQLRLNDSPSWHDTIWWVLSTLPSYVAGIFLFEKFLTYLIVPRWPVIFFANLVEILRFFKQYV